LREEVEQLRGLRTLPEEVTALREQVTQMSSVIADLSRRVQESDSVMLLGHSHFMELHYFFILMVTYL
jgi:hypothetical protein